MRASEVMIADPVVAAAGATSSEVAALMRVKNISVVPVVDNPKDRHYLGTISDSDIVSRCVWSGHGTTHCSASEHSWTYTPGVMRVTAMNECKHCTWHAPYAHH